MGRQATKLFDALKEKISSSPVLALPNLRHSFEIQIDESMIQVDIDGHPPFPTGSKQFSGNFGNLLFLAVLNLWGHFEGLNEGFLGSSFSMISKVSN
jgi:hypothetical protein